MTMDAITLTEPWAILMIARRLDIGIPPKRIESRNWPPNNPMDRGTAREGVRGRRLGLHAGKGIDSKLRKAISNGVVFHRVYAQALIACGYSPLDPWDKRYAERLEIANREPDMIAMRALTGLKDPPSTLKPIPLGQMIGIITLDRVLRGREVEAMERSEQPLFGVEAEGPRNPWQFGDYQRPIDSLEIALGFYDETEERRYGWVTRDSVELPEPITTRGYQKLWRIPPDVLATMQAETSPPPTMGVVNATPLASRPGFHK
jgi:hypothetical protein